MRQVAALNIATWVTAQLPSLHHPVYVSNYNIPKMIKILKL